MKKIQLNTTTKKLRTTTKHTIHKRKRHKYNNQVGGDLKCTTELGTGFSAVTFLCEKDGTEYAGKFANKTRPQDFKNELGIYNELYDDAHKDTVSPNILRYYKVAEDETKTFDKRVEDKIYENLVILLELCKGNLFDLLEQFRYHKKLLTFTVKATDVNWLNVGADKVLNFNDADKSSLYWYIGKQIFNGLYYLFERQIVHFDIKAENILVCNQTGYDILKIGDFGFAKKLQDITDTDLKRGTKVNMPPFLLWYTSFFRDLYAYIVTLILFTEFKIFNINESTGKPYLDTQHFKDKLFKQKEYTVVNTYFYNVIEIICDFETKIISSYKKKYLQTSDDILQEYKQVYDAIKNFFDNPVINKDWNKEQNASLLKCAKDKNLQIGECLTEQQPAKNKIADNGEYEEVVLYDEYNCCTYTVRKPKHKLSEKQESNPYARGYNP